MTSRYTHGHEASVLANHARRTADNSAAYLIASLEAGMDLLDVGCGPGTITIDLARSVYPGRVIGVDTSAAVVETARAAAQRAGVTNVSFGVADVYALADCDLIGSRTFDVVHAHQVLQHLPDPIRALQAMGEVSSREGLVAVRDADYEAMTWAPGDPRLDRWLELYRAVARANAGEPDAGRRVLGWVRAAGFTDVTAGASVWSFADAESRQWWASTWADRITETTLADQIVGAGLADRDELDEIARAWHEWAVSPDGWFAVLHGEVLARREVRRP